MWLFVSILCCVFYAALLTTYLYGWHILVVPMVRSDYVPRTRLCVIVPARNESLSIGACLSGILSQDYPADLLEVIVVDDHSTDDTAAIAARFAGVKVLHLSEHISLNIGAMAAYKKKAIEIAISQTECPLIVTTDADCVAGSTWLKRIVHLHESSGAQMIAAPVCFFDEKTWFDRFQSLDFAGMMVSTGASLRLGMGAMCNGANLAYSRAAFNAVEGFRNIDHIASGDDMLLMTKIIAHYGKHRVVFLKDRLASVFTRPQTGFMDFVHQRLRWASKSGKYQDFRITFWLALVYFFNVSLLFNLVWGTLPNNFFYLQIGLLQLLVKSFFDFLLLVTGCRFFGRNDLMRLFVCAQVLHILYIVVIGTMGNIIPYKWKGRQLR